MASSKEKFLHLLYNDLLKVDLADLDFSFYPILECPAPGALPDANRICRANGLVAHSQTVPPDGAGSTAPVNTNRNSQLST
ncbi:hypothetical protein [uncultured Thiohalocapsa sp.]|uniref:hypothetical protein n=1 Tax=uncultured Thiohalocapsa sp. TaxID=768990 RepID=UPI0025F82E5C|nr:hypothetical protein [uncultured Thiohalocapsa sp.]